MAEIISKYVPTIWRNEITPIDQDKMNNMEVQLVNSQKAENILTGVVNRDRLPLAESAKYGVVKLSDSINDGTGVSYVAATPKAIHTLKMNCAIVDSTSGNERVALKATTAVNLSKSVKVSLVGGVTGSVSFSAGGEYNLSAIVVPGQHIHTYEQISSYANNVTPGIVYAYSSPDAIPAKLRSYDIPNVEYLRGVQTALKSEINTNKKSIDTNSTRISAIVNLDTAVNNSSTELGKWKTSFDSLLNWKNISFPEYQQTVENQFTNLESNFADKIQDTQLNIREIGRSVANNSTEITNLENRIETTKKIVDNNVLEIQKVKMQAQTNKENLVRLENAILNIADYLRITEEDLFAPRPSA